MGEGRLRLEGLGGEETPSWGRLEGGKAQGSLVRFLSRLRPSVPCCGVGLAVFIR